MPRTFMVQVGEQYVVLFQREGNCQEYLCATRELAQRWLKLLQAPPRVHVSPRAAA